MFIPLNRLRLSVNSKIIIAVYTVTVFFWVMFVIYSRYTATLDGWIFHYLLTPFLIGMTVLPLVAGALGVKNAMGWNGTKSIMGRSTLGISLGLIAWAGGMVIWNYYLYFTHVEVPYPSAADIVFILSWPLWTYGLYQLSRIITIPSPTHVKKKLAFPVLLTILIAAISVYLLVVVARGGIAYENLPKLFFDLFYPLGDMVILWITVLLLFYSRKVLGGAYKMPILILFVGFLMNFISDFLFSFSTTRETYFNGHIVDFLFTTTMFILGLGLSMLSASRE